MKKILPLAIICLLLLLFSACDKINLPWHHHKGDDHQLNNIVCTGNRIVSGPSLTNQQKYPNQLLKNLQHDGYDPVTVSVVADIPVSIQAMTAQIGENVDPHKVNDAVNIVIVTEILEDTRDNHQPPEVSANLLRQYCEQARAHGWKVIVSTAPYANPFYEWYPTPPFPDGNSYVSNSGYDSTGFIAQISQINALVRNDYTAYADGLLDLASDARLATYSSKYFMANHLDLTAEGAGVVAQLAEQALKQHLAK
jgi:hypothetical protein